MPLRLILILGVCISYIIFSPSSYRKHFHLPTSNSLSTLTQSIIVSSESGRGLGMRLESGFWSFSRTESGGVRIRVNTQYALVSGLAFSVPLPKVAKPLTRAKHCMIVPKY